MRIKHGGNIYEAAKRYGIAPGEIIDFSANINPFGIPDSLKEAIISNIDILENYPDPEYESLVKSIGIYNKVDEKFVIPGNGATEVIFLIIGALAPQKALLLAPTFSEYERALRRYGSSVNYFLLKEENNFCLDKDEFLKNMKKDTDLIILCNPNNPTGQIVERKDLIEILEKCRESNTYLMLDEAFIEFIDNEDKVSMEKFVDRFDNLFIIKALTKFFAIPGLRLGYGLTSNTRIREKIKDIREPWTINGFASIAAQTLLQDENYIFKSKEFFRDERKYLYESLKKIKELRVYKPEANYIFFKILKGNIDLKEELIKRKILIRDCSNYVSLSKGYYRAAIRDRVSNDKLINALKEVVYED